MLVSPAAVATAGFHPECGDATESVMVHCSVLADAFSYSEPPPPDKGWRDLEVDAGGIVLGKLDVGARTIVVVKQYAPKT